ncbi:SRR1-domain-containing protein, partial [Pilatotrama ljubarskyi]
MAHDEGNPQFDYDDHFAPARTRKKRKNRPQAAPPSPDVLLDRASQELTESDWLREAQRPLRESLEEAFVASDAAPDVLCLGLGSPASSRDARAQLAFLLAACDDLSIDRTKVSVYDPVFAKEDLELLARLKLTPLPENRHASYGLRSPTIVFMPHCDLHLYENLLRENWSRAHLANVLLIANRLSEYAESIPSRKLASEHPCVARLAPYLTSRPFPPCTAFPTAFNNTSIQFARSDVLAERSSNWWTLPGALGVPERTTEATPA